MDEADFSFEQQWADTFDQAEQTPPAHVWVAIDGQLANAEAKEYKKRLLIYQWVAAACALLLMVFGLGYWTQENAGSSQQIQSDIQTTTPTESNAVLSSSNNVAESQEILPLENVAKNNGSGGTTLTPMSQPVLIIEETHDPNYEVKAGLRSRKSNELFLANFTVQHLNPDDTRIAETSAPDFLYGVPNTAYIEDQKHAMLWAGVSMSSGSFDPAFHSGSSSASSADMMASPNADFVSQSSAKSLNDSQLQYEPGYSISGGFNVGTKLKNRLIFSSGLHYQSFNTADAQTTVVSDGNDYYALTRNSNDQALNDATENSVLSFESTEVSLRNQYQYMSIPIKAGYVILDKKFNIIFNTGLSSNFLLDAQLVNKDSDQKLSNDLDTSGEYESVYFNFLTSVEFGYLIWNKYQITLEPNYNQALTNFTNSNNESQGKPQNIGVSFGLKYNF